MLRRGINKIRSLLNQQLVVLLVLVLALVVTSFPVHYYRHPRNLNFLLNNLVLANTKQEVGLVL